MHRQTHDGLTKYVMDLLKGLGMKVEYRTVEQQVTKTKAETIESNNTDNDRGEIMSCLDGLSGK